MPALKPAQKTTAARPHSTSPARASTPRRPNCSKAPAEVDSFARVTRHRDAGQLWPHPQQQSVAVDELVLERCRDVNGDCGDEYAAVDQMHDTQEILQWDAFRCPRWQQHAEIPDGVAADGGPEVA